MEFCQNMLKRNRVVPSHSELVDHDEQYMRTYMFCALCGQQKSLKNGTPPAS